MSVSRFLRFTLQLIALLLLVLVGLIAWLRQPKTILISQTPSASGTWVAVVEKEDYASMFTPPYYRVSLRPHGWLGAWRAHVICEATDMSSLPPTVTWTAEHVLHIDTHALVRDIVHQEARYKEIEISY